MQSLLIIVAGWTLMAIVMYLLWLLQRRTGDAGIVDVAWGLGVALIASAFCFFADGLPARRWAVALLVAAWAVRLSGYVLVRVLNMPEDGRYQTLKQQWGSNSGRNMLLFYQFQAFGSLLFALPMLIAASNPNPWSGWDYAAVGLWLVAIVGESLADRQLHRFRTDPANRQGVCRTGFWYYSRHPNYFFEWLHWWTYVLFAVSASAAAGWINPWGLINLIFPLAMLYFILYKTGIPPTEAQSLKSRGDAYREYQRTTSAFFPWPPRTSTMSRVEGTLR